MTSLDELFILLESWLYEVRIIRARRVPPSIRRKRRQYYRRKKARIKRMARQRRRKPRQKRLAKRRAAIRKRLHLRPGSRRRIRLASTGKMANLTEGLKVTETKDLIRGFENAIKLSDQLIACLGNKLTESKKGKPDPSFNDFKWELPPLTESAQSFYVDPDFEEILGVKKPLKECKALYSDLERIKADSVYMIAQINEGKADLTEANQILTMIVESFDKSMEKVVSANPILESMALTWEKLPNGDLEVSLKNPEDAQELDPEEDFHEAFEYMLANGLDSVTPEEVGAMTDAPIFGDVSRNDQGEIEKIHSLYWYPNYAVKNPAEELKEKGRVIFKDANDQVESKQVTEAERKAPVSDDELTDAIFDFAQGLKDKVEKNIEQDAKALAKQLGLNIRDMVRSDMHGVIELEYALQLTLAAYLENPRMVKDFFHLIKDEVPQESYGESVEEASSRPIERGDYVKAVSGHFKGKTGWVSRVTDDTANVVWKGVWEHGIWTPLSDLKRIGSEKKKAEPSEEAKQMKVEASEHEADVDQYIETALWSSTGEDGKPLDEKYSQSDLSGEALDQAQKDLDSFIKRAGNLLDDLDASDVAHDFWLTRNRHGAGFWDGDYEKSVATALTDLSHEFGEVDLYVGDDGKLYFSGGGQSEDVGEASHQQPDPNKGKSMTPQKKAELGKSLPGKFVRSGDFDSAKKIMKAPHESMEPGSLAASVLSEMETPPMDIVYAELAAEARKKKTSIDDLLHSPDFAHYAPYRDEIMKERSKQQKELGAEESVNEAAKEFHIVDWANNEMFGGKTFASFDDAEEFLSIKLGDSYEEDRQEYEIVPTSHKSQQGKFLGTRYLDPRDPRGSRDESVSEAALDLFKAKEPGDSPVAGVPKKWFAMMHKELSNRDPGYSDEQIKKHIKAIWNEHYSQEKRDAIMAKESTDDIANLGEDITNYIANLEEAVLDKSPIHTGALVDAAMERHLQKTGENLKQYSSVLWKEFDKLANKIVQKEPYLKKLLKDNPVVVRDALHHEADDFLRKWLRKKQASKKLEPAAKEDVQVEAKKKSKDSKIDPDQMQKLATATGMTWDGGDDDRLFHEEMHHVFANLMTAKEYTAMEKDIAKYVKKGPGYEVYTWNDASSYEYWKERAEDGDDANYIQVTAAISDPSKVEPEKLKADVDDVFDHFSSYDNMEDFMSKKNEARDGTTVAAGADKGAEYLYPPGEQRAQNQSKDVDPSKKVSEQSIWPEGEQRAMFQDEDKKYILDVTYGIVTPESASEGDYSETGYHEEDVVFDSLPEMVLYMKQNGASEPAGHSGVYYSADPEVDYRTGEETSYGFHPKNVSKEEVEEIDKLMKMGEKELAAMSESFKSSINERRKVTDLVSQAFFAGDSKKVGNTHTDGKSFFLHNNEIAKKEDGKLFITDAGWPTRTTQERLNGILDAFGIQGGVFQKARKQMISVGGEEKPWDGSWTVVKGGEDAASNESLSVEIDGKKYGYSV